MPCEVQLIYVNSLGVAELSRTNILRSCGRQPRRPKLTVATSAELTHIAHPKQSASSFELVQKISVAWRV